MKNDTITFIDNRSGKKHNFTIKKGSSGPDVVDLTSFFSKKEWIWFYKNLKYTGDYEFIYFK